MPLPTADPIPARPPEREAPKPIVLLHPFQGYDVNVGQKTFKGFRVVSEWNGMLEMTDGSGNRLIVDPGLEGATERMFHKLGLDVIFGNDPKRRATIIKASPDLYACFLAEIAENSLEPKA